MTAAVEIVREPARAATLLDPERRRLLGALAQGPDSASGLARRLGETRQRLNYHLRLLEEAGLVELAEQRGAGDRSERILRLVARRFVLDPAALGEMAAEPDDVGDRFSANYLVALASRAIRELAALLHRARTQRARVATMSINASVRLAQPRDFEAFVKDLTRAVTEVIARHHDERGAVGGRWFRVVAGAYPGPDPGTKPEGGHQ